MEPRTSKHQRPPNAPTTLPVQAMSTMDEIEGKVATKERKPMQNPENVPEVASVTNKVKKATKDKDEEGPVPPEIVEAATHGKPSTFTTKRFAKLPAHSLQSPGRGQRSPKALLKHDKKNRLSRHAQEFLDQESEHAHSLPTDIAVDIEKGADHEASSSLSSGTKSLKSAPSHYSTEDLNFTAPIKDFKDRRADFLFDGKDSIRRLEDIALEDGRDSTKVDKYGVPIPPRSVDMDIAEDYLFDKVSRPKSFSMAMNDYLMQQMNNSSKSADDDDNFESFEDEPPPVIRDKKSKKKQPEKIEEEEDGFLDRVSTHLRSRSTHVRARLHSVFGVEGEPDTPKVRETPGQGYSHSNQTSGGQHQQRPGYHQRGFDPVGTGSDDSFAGSQDHRANFTTDRTMRQGGSQFQPVTTDPHDDEDVVIHRSGSSGIYRSSHEQDYDKHNSTMTYQRMFMAICAFILVVFFAVMAVLFFTNAFPQPDPPSVQAGPRSKPDRPTPKAPPPFTVGPVGEKGTPYSSDEVIQLLQASVMGDLMDDPRSPRGKALEWVVEDAAGNPPSSDFRVIQRFILATFHFATINDRQHWINVQNWLSVEHECTWFGVRCGTDGSPVFPETNGRKLQPPDVENPLSERVTYLNLSENNLHGSIPDELSVLTDLAQIHLQGNYLEGKIPESLGEIFRLHTVFLDNNFLTGRLPATIGYLSFLENFDVSSNSMQGAIPDMFDDFSNLVSFRCDNNNFSGQLPLSLSELKNAEVLTLGNNKIGGKLPSGISQLSKLGILHLHENNLKGSIPIFTSPELEEIHLDNNAFTGAIPEIRDSSYLKELRLERNKLSSGIPLQLGNHVELEILWIDHNKLTGGVPHELGRLEELKSLKVNGNNLSGTVPPSLCSLRSSGLLRTLQATCEGNSKLACACCTSC